ncbi:MAG: hypothetical protein KAT91_00515 [Candidatus Aenigmarchaeota archaeon]|nr:hypothetical protein [Candidatus Aenigmarchaeota archaeon]
MNQKIFVLSLLLAALVAGCTDGGTQGTGKEILMITDFDSFPKNTIHPGETLILRATVKNVADVPATFAVGENGRDILFDHCESLYILTGGFEILTGQPTEDSMTLKPHQEAMFQWTFTAPSEEKIGADMGLSHECTFKTQIKYESSARTTSYVYFADQNEVIQRAYTSKELSLKGDSIATKGPVVANLIPSMDQPIPVKDQDSEWTFYIQLQNKGDGIVNVTSLTIEGAVCDFEDQKDKFKIYGQKSSRIACTTKTPIVDILTPKKYTIDVEYEYTTRKDLKIKTEAFKY